ncbi:hypothetical protein I3843_05G098200 [Carya illinoinensis]|uniref:Uncharacterized protein n=1 Tax=Carya illinoinensis TaxID=32201 RepID=A0A8T1QGU3_CARIL|nr:uncharacterized protein LOC122310617 [Carya illinoinensis]KAG6653890.1 hypothetical protein CIPAW_05G108100 [Carya illinoinensis]KAG6712472.1 hypothetical protein I3842_05G105500 [Carya illinoinensis]KAG7978767.1 hypothetical protein I3843_05G098200 [Carya illinoinensis]
MDSNNKLELINIAIQRVIKEKKIKPVSGTSDGLVEDDHDDRLLLSRLLSELESLEGDNALKESEALSEVEEENPSPAVGIVDVNMGNARQVDRGGVEIGAEEIVKELKKVKRQNFVTHCLLSAMIVLTVAWQLSEVTLIWKVKKGLSNPFRSVGSLLAGMLKGPATNGQDTEKLSSLTKELPSEAPSLPLLKIPEIPHMDLPDLGLNGSKDK